MEKQTERIIHGATFSGIFSTIGSVILVASILMFRISIITIIPFIFLIIGLIFLLSIELIEIDYNQRKIRKVLYFIFYKHGKWISFDNFDTLILGADHESFKMVSPVHPFFQKDFNLRAYDIYIVNSNDPTMALLFLSCNNIPLAQEKLKEYSEKLNIEMIDTIKQGWERARERERR
ncbi:MAG: hypothetical protein HXX18_03010 [Bacteroidetes bacterium]|nr:hypothetical protein [Bacteroidota bacterium]